MKYGWICPICGVVINPNYNLCPNACSVGKEDIYNTGNTVNVSTKIKDGYLVTKIIERDSKGNKVFVEEKWEPLSTCYKYPYYDDPIYYPSYSPYGTVDEENPKRSEPT